MPNPFSNLLNPDKQGTLTGFLGGVMGNPSKSEDQGNATGAALQNLAQLKEQGLGAQQSLLKFFQSPQGMDYFTRTGPEGLDKLTAGLTELYKQPPTTNVGAGGAVVAQQPDGTMKELYKNPAAGPGTPAAVTAFNYFADLARLTPEQRAELARAQIAPTDKTEKGPSEEKQAIDRLVESNSIDRRTGDAMKAGFIQVIPAKDQFGNSTGDVTIVDVTNKTSTLIPKTAVPVDPSKPVNPNVSQPAVGVLPPSQPDPTKNSEYFGSKADMFLGAGAVPYLAGTVSKLGEQADSSLIMPEGAKANDRVQMLKTLKASIAGMGSMDGGLGINKNVVESMLALTPEAGVFSSPHTAVQQGMRLLQLVQQEIGAEEEKTTRDSLPQSERVNAAKRMEGWKKVERNLPTMDEMVKMESAIREGKAGALTPRSALEAGSKYLDKAKKNVQSQAGMQDFSSMGVEELSKINPRSLDTPALQKFNRRILQLKNGAK